MGKYKAYPEYKLSGSRQVDSIPVSWNTKQIKHLGILKGGAGFPHEEQGIIDAELSFHKVNSLGKADRTGNLKRGDNSISAATAKRLGAFVFPPSSIVFAKVGAALLLSRIRSLTEASCIDNNMMGLIVNEKYDAKFLKYAMHEIKFDYIVNPGAIPSLNEFQMGNLKLPIPPQRQEQTQIANFLDHETAKIDTLIEKQQQLIKLLKEKRQALISHAVTKGLNPQAPMKDSGVEWLGEVPEHWGVLRLKHLIESLESGVSVNAADIPARTKEVGVLKTSCVYTRTFRAEENKTVVPEDLQRVKCPVRKGAIIISRMNTPELVGASALVNEDVSNVYLPDRLWQTNFNQEVDLDSEYLAHFMTVEGFRVQISLAAEGASSSMQNIAKEDYLSINCLLPPLSEQQQIVQYIRQRIEYFSKLDSNANDAVNLLKERRTALISAAVTGKIDVRHFTLKDGQAPISQHQAMEQTA
ncbi:restriction endonuclease subunit S [Vibrio aquimaris]|uniref:Type-1 restriction enzyme EcoKI specificity protein n=1 Tax=Vibrio aquimaris TaxID=2587862 RepID=A0A5P9CID0_9VIBR|nr:restriction endonuclease subunit S [Vibrio aquimaris]QFT25457.1 Type-1 restriction enzyme EcoKI specificity protein [Vibrio aquimaris]